jgi:hypothetical protein
MTMNIKGTGCEDVDWIYMTRDVVDWCAHTSDLHKRMEILSELRKIYFAWKALAMEKALS